MRVMAGPTWGENVVRPLSPSHRGRWQGTDVPALPPCGGLSGLEITQMLPTSVFICGVAVLPQTATSELAGTEGR